MPSARLDDIGSLAVFARVVETKSFTAAAEALGVSKAAVSQRIAALEKQCAAKLLLRTTRRLSLTAEGESLYQSCAGLTVAADAASAMLGRVGKNPEGVVRVTAPVGFGMAEIVPMLPELVRKHPDVSVELDLLDRFVDIVGEGYDVAIRFAFTERLEDSSFGARKLGRDQLEVCAAPSYFELHGEPREPEDLRRHRCIGLNTYRGGWTFKVGARQVTIPVTGPVRCNDIRVLRDAALLGLGIALLPHSVTHEDIRAGRLRVVLADTTTLSMSIWAMFPSRQIPAKSRVFVSMLENAIRHA